MTFAHPALLLFLWAVPLAAALWVWMRRRAAARLLRFGSAPRSALSAMNPEARFGVQLALVAAGSALAITAAARPRWGEREELVLSKGRNVVIAIDVSRSMLAEDVRPNRLDRARADLRDLLADLRGDRAGLMAFRSGAVLLCPLTTDVAFLREALENLTVDAAPRGETNIGTAILKAVEALDAFPGDHNAVILISDGEDLGGKAVEAARKAGERGIPIFTVGIGDARGAAIPATGGGRVQFKGEEVVTRLDNQTLLDVASASGGAYIPLQTAGTGRVTLGTLYQRHLRNVAAQDLQERSERRKVERYQLFLIPAILCFVVAALYSLGRPVRRRRARAVAAAAAAIWIASMVPVQAAEATATNAPATKPVPTVQGRDLAREAQAAFRAGRYREAAEGFRSAAQSPALDARTATAFRFNAALAALRGGSPTNAAELFRGVVRAEPELAAAQEGLGAALFEAATKGTNATDAGSIGERAGLLDEAAAAFQQALRGVPADDARRRNLAAAAERIPALRDEAHLADILKQHGQTPPDQLLTDLLRRQRQAYAAAAAATTNDSPTQIAQLEAAAKAQREAADLWLPLAPKLMQAFQAGVTNQQQLAQIQQQLSGARDRMRAAADTLRDLDPAGLESVARGERDTMQFFAAVAPPPPILDEAIFAQTNALRTVASADSPRTPALDQAAAQAFMTLFSERFPAWADQMAKTPPATAPDGEAASTNAPPPLTPEQRAEIEALTAETLRLHAAVLAEPALADGRLAESTAPQRQQALEKMLRIRELLPKPPSQNKSQPQEQPSPPKESKDPPKDPPKEQPPKESPEQKPEQSPEAKPDEKSEAKPMPEDLKGLMERVLRREREHEDEKQRRLHNLPPLLNERDW